MDERLNTPRFDEQFRREIELTKQQKPVFPLPGGGQLRQVAYGKLTDGKGELCGPGEGWRYEIKTSNGTKFVPAGVTL